MAKPPKYPKKLRQKLEKVAEAREERAADAEHEAVMEKWHGTLWREFLPSASCQVIQGELDPHHFRINTTYSMTVPVREYLDVRAPWLREKATQ